MATFWPTVRGWPPLEHVGQGGKNRRIDGQVDRGGALTSRHQAVGMLPTQVKFFQRRHSLDCAPGRDAETSGTNQPLERDVDVDVEQADVLFVDTIRIGLFGRCLEVVEDIFAPGCPPVSRSHRSRSGRGRGF